MHHKKEPTEELLGRGDSCLSPRSRWIVLTYISNFVGLVVTMAMFVRGLCRWCGSISVQHFGGLRV